MKRTKLYSQLLLITAIASLLITVVVPTFILLHSQALDLKSYYIAGHLALENRNIYDPMLQSHVARAQGLGQHFYPYIYFPMLALIWMPFAMLSFPVVQWIWFILSTLCFYGSLLVLWSMTRSCLPGIPKIQKLQAAVIVLACSLMEGISTNAINGQINALILLFLVLFLAGVKNGNDIPAGICLGILIMIKPQPAVLIPYLVLVGRSKSAIAAFLTAIIGTVVTGSVIGWNNFMYYFNEVAPTFNMIKTSFPPILIQAPPNTSLQGAISRLLLPSPFTTPVLYMKSGVSLLIRLVVLGLLTATFYHLVWNRKRTINFLQLWLECGWLILLSLLISPLTWSHHYTLLPVFAIPLLLMTRLEHRNVLFIISSALWLTIACPMFQMKSWILNSSYVHLALSFQTLCMMMLFAVAGIFLVGRQSTPKRIDPDCD